MWRLVWLTLAFGGGGCRGSRGGSLSAGGITDGPLSDASPFPTSDAGSANYALSFDGLRDYATAANAGFAAASAAQTIELWIKYASVSQATNEDLYVSRMDFGGGIHLGFHAGTLAAWRVYVDRLLVHAPALPSANTWHHIAYTFDGAAHTLYVDGSAVDTETSMGDDRTPTSVWLGSQDGSRNLFGGLMDEVRVWNVARTPAEIATDRAHTRPGAVAGLVAYWTFDDVASGGYALDASGTGNTVTLGDGVANAMPQRVVSDAPVSP